MVCDKKNAKKLKRNGLFLGKRVGVTKQRESVLAVNVERYGTEETSLEVGQRVAQRLVRPRE